MLTYVSDAADATIEYAGELLTPANGSPRSMMVQGMYMGIGFLVAPLVIKAASAAADLVATGAYSAGQWVAQKIFSDDEQPQLAGPAPKAPTPADIAAQIAALQAQLAALNTAQAKSA